MLRDVSIARVFSIIASTSVASVLSTRHQVVKGDGDSTLSASSRIHLGAPLPFLLLLPLPQVGTIVVAVVPEAHEVDLVHVALLGAVELGGRDIHGVLRGVGVSWRCRGGGANSIACPNGAVVVEHAVIHDIANRRLAICGRASGGLRGGAKAAQPFFEGVLLVPRPLRIVEVGTRS